MSHTFHLILRCDTGHRDTRCKAYFIGSSGMDIAEVRDAAARKGWTWTPGQPYQHVGAMDLCREHS